MVGYELHALFQIAAKMGIGLGLDHFHNTQAAQNQHAYHQQQGIGHKRQRRAHQFDQNTGHTGPRHFRARRGQRVLGVGFDQPIRRMTISASNIYNGGQAIFAMSEPLSEDLTILTTTPLTQRQFRYRFYL